MRSSTIVQILVSLLLTSFSSLSAKATTDPGLHTFYGEVVLIDPVKKVIELKTGKQRFVFYYNDQTRVSSSLGQVNLTRIVRGTGAAIVMRVGEGNAGIATEIRFIPGSSLAQTLALISGRTVHGETINGAAVGKFVKYEPPADSWLGGAPLERQHNAGLFVLSVATDGTVADVAVKQSSGYPELDARAEKWMKKWRFQPNSLKEVQLPMYFSESRHY